MKSYLATSLILAGILMLMGGLYFTRKIIREFPSSDTRTRQIEYYDVLIRMLDAQNELIMPNGFLRTAERFGLSVDIDKWVIVHAIESLAKQRRKDPNLRYAINLSGQTIQPDYNRQQTIPEISMPVSPTELVFMLPLREPETIPLSSKSRTD